MSFAKNGDLVSVNYVGSLDNEVIFDSTENRDPLKFIIGTGSLIPKFEEAVLGMKIGDKKKIYIDAKEAYGEYSDEMKFEVDKSEMPEGINLEVGTPLQLLQEDGSVSYVKVSEIKDNTVIIDANHPLAGQNLTFNITLVALKDAKDISDDDMPSCSCGCGDDCEDDDCGCDDDSCDCK
ncbi:MAG TPA: peptidylprolyl isomerase [Spirochaetota bacterium]|nr:peptidylprolyl isomerase [Spirochaetota bacterium]